VVGEAVYGTRSSVYGLLLLLLLVVVLVVVVKG